MYLCKGKKLFGILCACVAFSAAGHQTTYAEPDTTMEAADVAGMEAIEAEAEDAEVEAMAQPGSTYEVIEQSGENWLKNTAGQMEGFIRAQSEEALTKMGESVEEAAVAAEAFIAEQSMLALRQSVVDYALSFVGGRYVYGGNDPHTGVDCSGFVRYVMQHGAGVSLNRSSTYQATQGVSICAEQMQPGDLIFYGKGQRINHVAMYIGDGKVVHASTEKTGIKTSLWNYRTPLKIVNVLG